MARKPGSLERHGVIDTQQNRRIGTHRSGSGSSISAHVFKSAGLTITWYSSTKTLQLQGKVMKRSNA